MTKRGSDLFEQITRLDEYYLTRAETEILRNKAGDIADFCGEGALIHTESSRKFDLVAFEGLVEMSGWRVANIWRDSARRFAVFGLSASIVA